VYQLASLLYIAACAFFQSSINIVNGFVTINKFVLRLSPLHSLSVCSCI